MFFQTSGVFTGPYVTDSSVSRSGRQRNAWQAFRFAVHGFLVTEWALQRTETSLIEQCRLLGFRAAVAMQNLDDVCEEHEEHVRQVSKLRRRDSTADEMRQCIWGLVWRTESSDNGRNVPLFTFQSGIAVRFWKWLDLFLILTRSCFVFLQWTCDCIMKYAVLLIVLCIYFFFYGATAELGPWPPHCSGL